MTRFRICDLLWLTALAAILVAWWLDRSRLWKRGEEDRAQIELYKLHRLDKMLDALLHKPPAGPTSVRVKSPIPIPAPDLQMPPADRTPWIERVERQVIDRETPSATPRRGL